MNRQTGIIKKQQMINGKHEGGKQEIEDLAMLIQKIKKEQFDLSQKVQFNVQRLERSNIDIIARKYQQNNNLEEQNHDINSMQKKKEQEQLRVDIEHWSFSESYYKKSPSSIVGPDSSPSHKKQLLIANAQSQILNQQSLQNQNRIQQNDLNKNIHDQTKSYHDQIKNQHNELFFNSKDQNKNIIQGITLFRQDSSSQQLQQFLTQESNSSFNQGFDFNNNIQGYTNTCTTDTTTHATSQQQEQNFPKNYSNQNQSDQNIPLNYSNQNQYKQILLMSQSNLQQHDEQISPSNYSNYNLQEQTSPNHYPNLNPQEQILLIKQNRVNNDTPFKENTTESKNHMCNIQDLQTQIDQPLKEQLQKNYIKIQTNQECQSQFEQQLLKSEFPFDLNSEVTEGQYSCKDGFNDNLLPLQNEIKQLKFIISEQCLQIVQYKEIIQFKDDQLQKQTELEEAMKRITQGLLDQLHQQKEQVAAVNSQREEAQHLLFGLEEEYQKRVSELSKKQNQIKYILNENIQLEKLLAEVKRDFEIKMEEKYNSSYNQNYQGQIDCLMGIISLGESSKRDNQNDQQTNMQKQLTSQLRQINQSEFKLQQLRKQNSIFKCKMHLIAAKQLFTALTNKQSHFLSIIFSQSKSNH